MFSKLFPSMLHYGEDRIRAKVKRHLDGKLSYREALADSKPNVIIEWFSDAMHGVSPMSESQIHSLFNAELIRSQLKNSIHNFDMLMYHVLNSEQALADPSSYQKFFSNIEASNSQYELRLSLTMCDRPVPGLIMALTKYDRETNKVDNNFTKIYSIPNFSVYQLRDVLIEHAIYQHRQYGIDIPELVKTLPDEKNRIGKYLKEAEAYQYKAICFSGGGAKGVLYPGALEGLGEYRLCGVKKVSGASAGAITAALVASGMKPYEFTEFMHEVNLDITQNELITVVRRTMLATIKKRLKEFNESRDSSYMDIQQSSWINKYNGPNPSLTFNDLHCLNECFPTLGFKELFVPATYFRGKNPRCVELSIHTAPDMDVAKAVAASAALPGWFAELDVTADLLPKIKEKLKVANGEKVKVQDGGIVKNNPADLLLRSKCTRELSMDLSMDLFERDHPLDIFSVDENESNDDECFKDVDKLEYEYEDSKEEFNVGDDINSKPSKKESILCLGFEDSKDLHEIPPSFIERASCFIVGTDKMPGYQRFETRWLKNFNTHQMQIYGISVIGFKDATRRFASITACSKDDFIGREFDNRGKMKLTSLRTRQQVINDILFREVCAIYFGINKIKKQVLTKKIQITISDGTPCEMAMFDALCDAHENHNYEEFKRLYEEMRQEISRLKTKSNAFRFYW